MNNNDILTRQIIFIATILLFGTSVLRAENPQIEWNTLREESINFLKIGEYERAITSAEKALQIAETKMGLHNEALPMILEDLGRIYTAKKEHTQSEKYRLRALALWEKALGADNPNLINILDSMASFYLYDTKETSKAETLYLKSIAIAKKAHGTYHKSTLKSIENLCFCYPANEHAKIEPYQIQIIDISENLYGAEHPFVAEHVATLALLKQQKKDFVTAEKLLRRSISITEKVQGTEHPQLAQYLLHMAGLRDDQGEPNEAELLFKRALAIKEKHFGENHQEFVSCLYFFANHYDKRGNYEAAEPLYKKSLAIMEKLGGNNDRNIIPILEQMAKLYRKMNRHEEANKLEQRMATIPMLIK